MPTSSREDFVNGLLGHGEGRRESLVVIIKRLSLCQVAEISHFRVNARDRSV